jgi:cation:H+ antiporter
MLGFAFLILPLVFIPSKMRLEWRDGTVLLICYLLFLYGAIFT